MRFNVEIYSNNISNTSSFLFPVAVLFSLSPQINSQDFENLEPSQSNSNSNIDIIVFLSLYFV